MIYQYYVRDNTLNDHQDAIVDWCNETFGDCWWRDSLDTDYPRRTWFFKDEEDKVKFILRWI